MRPPVGPSRQAPAGAPAVPPPPRLDPFALPAATTARFLLMMVVAVTSAVHLYLVLLDRYVAGGTDLGPRGCALAAGSGAGRIPDGVLVSAYVECVQRESARTGWMVIGMVAGLLAVAVVIHLLHPRLVMLSRPRPLAQFAVDEGMAAVVRRVEDTVRALAPGTEVYVATLRASASGRAFGRRPRYRIILDLGLLRAADADPGQLDTVLAHELAHLRNKDVGLTTFAFAIWWAYLLVVALPLLLLAAVEPGLLAVLPWRLAAVLALLWFARTAVLRTREYYADLRGCATPDGERLLLDTLTPARADDGRRRRDRGPLSFHPGDEERAGVIRGAPRLFRIGVVESAAAGVLLGLGYSPCVHLVEMIFAADVASQFSPARLAVGVLFGALATGAVAGTVWRAGLLAQATHTRPPSTLPAALALTAGLVTGQLVAPPLATAAGSWADILARSPVIAVVLAVLLAVLFQLMLRWAVLCASVWLPLARRVRTAALAGSALSAVIFGAWLSFWFDMIAWMINAAAGWDILWYGLYSAALNPTLQLCVVLACAAASVGWAARRGLPPRPLAAVWRDAPPSRLAAPRMPLPAVNVTALAICLAYAGVMIPFYGWLRSALGGVPLKGAVPMADAAGHFTPLLIVATIVALAGAFCFGLAAGGRGGAAPVVAGTGVLMLLAVFGLGTLFVAHLAATVCGAGLFSSCMASFPRVFDLSQSGPIFTVGFTGLVVTGAAAAWLGSALRGAAQALSAAGPRPWGARPWHGVTGRPVGAVLSLVPTALAALLFGYLAVNTLSATGSTPVPVDRAVVARELRAAPRGPLPPARACSAVDAVSSGLLFTDTFDFSRVIAGMAGSAGYAMAARDPALQAMGRETATALLAGDSARAIRAHDALRHLCVVTGALPA
ncbi:MULTISPECIES: M48 family metalloprotease [unclassified Nonomuraea]|uniref:M48 family metalloprotease n=1 Tax=unclassified Nonomuraea TaxID=2593643 RepID=UPI0033E15259